MRAAALVFVAWLPVAGCAQRTPAAAPAPVTSSPAQPHNHPFALGNVLRVVSRALGPEPIVGTVDSLRGDVVVLDTVTHRQHSGLFTAGVVPVDQFRYVALRAADLRAVELRTGTSRSRGAVRNGIMGALIGGVVLGFGNLPQRNPGLGDFVGGFAAGAAVGGGIGVLIGSYSGQERWQRIEGPFYLSAPPSR